MNYITKFFGHLWMIIKHKYWVFYYSCKLGIPWQGFFHDFSKFHPIEFFESVKYYTGKKSPIVSCKEDRGYSLAWQHHKGHNPHHYEYWLDNFDKGTSPLIIPFNYVLEMTCDWLAAGKTYQGKNFNYKDELEWWKKKREEVSKSMHPAIINYFTFVFCYLARTNKLSKNRFKLYYNVALKEFYNKEKYEDNPEYDYGHNVPHGIKTENNFCD